MEHKWVHSSIYSSIPPDAVLGGNDVDGATIYVGRAFHNGDTLVAKVIPSKHAAYISWRGEEIFKEHFEVLCGTKLVWRHCYHHVIPENAVFCGKTSLDQPVYVGRGHCEGSLTVGKVSSVHRALFIPFKGGERRLETYELLVEERDLTAWPEDLPPPPPAVLEEKKTYPTLDNMKPIPPPIGFTAMPQPLSGYPNAPPQPGAFEPPPPYAPVPPPNAVQVLPTAASPYPPLPPPPPPSPPPMKSHYSGPSPNPFASPAATYQPLPQKTPASTYQPTPEILPAATYQPSSLSYGTPAATFHPPPTAYGHSTPAVTYCPTQHDTWVAASGSYTPPNTVHAGHDSDNASLVVCRAFHEGHLIPGKAVPSRACAYISYSGREIPKAHYELLVGVGYHWVPAHGGNVPSDAVEAGRTTSGEPLYVGRAHYCGSLTPGKIQRSHNCLYIPYGGTEQRITSYEVLVSRPNYYHADAMKICY